MWKQYFTTIPTVSTPALTYASTPTSVPAPATSQKSMWSDFLFYTTVTALGVGLTSVCYYGYKKWQMTELQEETNVSDISFQEQDPEQYDPKPEEHHCFDEENGDITEETLDDIF